MTKTNQQSAGFALFAFTWATAGFFHQMSFEGWRWFDIKGLLLTGCILLVLFKPSSWKRFAIFVLVDWISVAVEFPVHPNHIVFSWIVNGTLLTALIFVAKKGPSEATLESRWFNVFAPWVRVELCLLYFFTVFHKINISYFDIDWSCAALMHREIHDWMPVLPGAVWAQQWAIYGTLIIETAIPILLIGGRTRIWGVLLGILFHGLLALHRHPGLFSFSSTMTALFTLFLPLNAAAALRPPKILKKAFRWGLVAFTIVIIAWIIGLWLPYQQRMEQALILKNKIGFLTYFGYLAIGLFIIIQSIKTLRLETQHPNEGSLKTTPLLVIFPFVLFINGFGPYFGLRTQTSFSMFSNLHTENGMSNHLIMPSGIQITNWQYDLVEIIDSNDPALIAIRDRNLLVVYLELRRIRSRAPADFKVTFRRNQKVETFDIQLPDTHHVLPSLGFFGQRYFYFRPAERDPLNVSCKH